MKRLYSAITAILSTFALLIMSFYVRPHAVRAQSAQDLRDRTAAIQAEIDKNDTKLTQLGEAVDTLESKLEVLGLEITQAQNNIDLSTAKIAELVVKLDAATKELDRQKQLLRANFKQLYQRSGASSLELIVGSDNFTEYFNGLTYLELLKSSITESAQQVVQLKAQITTDKAANEELLAQQQVQKKLLDDKKAEQQTILAQTQGEQSKYAEIVASKQAELAQAEQDLKELLDRLARESQGGNTVSYGYVQAGQRVGSVGSTGYSTGPHLHFAAYQNGSFINPTTGGQQLINNFTWPVPSRDWGDVSQDYGCVAPYAWYPSKCQNGNSYHNGLDIGGWYGEAVVAAASGNIVFRGWQVGFGFTVMIDHGGGLITYYPHMLAE